MNLIKANHKQLITLALHEEVSVDMKYRVCRELQKRRKERKKYWRDMYYSSFKGWY